MGDSLWGWQRQGRLAGPAYFVVLAATAIGLVMVLNQITNGALGLDVPIETAYYYLVIAIFLAVAFLVHPARHADDGHLPWYDWLLAGLTLVTGIYFATVAQEIINRGWDFDAPPLPTAASTVLCLLALEGVRRCGGGPLFVICAIFFAFPVYADYMPGFLWGPPTTFAEAMRSHAMGVESIIGIPLRTVSSLLIGFLVFGVALAVTGGGAFFMELATALMGASRGGPAKVSILASGFFGSLSGSVISNVITTGNMTIPTMKRTGYAPAYAGAVEACASTGGALMPPVMGAVAFIMASFLNVTYATVMAAAIVPALLFYIALVIQADCYAARVGLQGLPREEIPAIGPTLAGGWPYLVALAWLMFCLLGERAVIGTPAEDFFRTVGVGSEGLAPFSATVVLLVLGFIGLPGMRSLDVFLELMVESGKAVGNLLGILAGVGLIVGALAFTGVGTAFSRELLQYAGGNVYLLLVFGAATSFILGMGMTVSACYIFLAIVLAPALTSGGLNEVAAHMFILYWAMLSYITPPVAIAAVAAATIAKASPITTGFVAMRLGLVLFFLPFMFVLNPALILDGGIFEVTRSVTTALVAVWLLSAGFERYLHMVGQLAPVQATLAVIAGGLLMAPELWSDIGGFLIAVGLIGHGIMLQPRISTA